MNLREDYEAIYLSYHLSLFFPVLENTVWVAQLCQTQPSGFSQACNVKLVCLFVCHPNRILHLAIIHEDEYFAHQLIQLFPKDVLDIQNNLYQVREICATQHNLKSGHRSSGTFWHRITSS